jgi:hypothetical protein
VKRAAKPGLRSRVRRRTSTPAKAATAKPATVAPKVKLTLGDGTYTFLEFDEGVPEWAVGRVAQEVMYNRRADRRPGDVWVVQLGEYFMLEGRPVLAFSTDVAKTIVSDVEANLTSIFEWRRRRVMRSKIAFRGRALVWLQDGFERQWPVVEADAGGETDA